MDSILNYDINVLNDRQSTLDLKKYDYVIVIGVGGIGNWVAFNFALTGLADKMILIDPDHIECSNLNRTIFRVSDIGKPKVLATKYLIMERRPYSQILVYQEKFDVDKHITDSILQSDNVCIIDCRDDIYDDIKKIPENIKIWKLGYDGVEITVDANPRHTKVWGTSNGYEVTPSYLCSSQLIANIVVNHIVMPDLHNDRLGRFISGSDKTFNSRFTYNTSKLMVDMYRLANNHLQLKQRTH